LILTPHPAEFDRLYGEQAKGSYDRLAKAMNMAVKMHAHIILKGHYTAVCCPDGEVYINSTGNAGMATAGAGDVLTGILAGLLARGYNRTEACMLGVYIHGLAGDIARDVLGEESLVAGDIIKYLPEAFKRLYSADNNNNE
ncbi:MAG: bifunctional ADP-dependent NAD(P)H-hydrate dehydratase/NAD(P)H-hydrate epimerase, partial [Prevotella sp.]|nr:bifunctional ADP-dependent NAD(P)H-hydrate dehydratase/NAD(P)H-hydrate epimerase [Prevotella sp.]